MKLTLALAVFLLATAPTHAQTVSPEPPTITSTTTLVLVPTLVRSPTGELIPNLQAKDFHLTDNGVEQKVSVEPVERQPLAVVVLMQTGAAAPRQFPNYRDLTPLLEHMMGSSAYRVALVTFDSRPEENWDFSSSIDGLADAFTQPRAGDSGAAILDAVQYGVDLLQQQPSTARRILLLLSQPQDGGSKAQAADVIRHLGESNTTIYSVTFSPEKQWLKDQFTQPRQGNKLYKFAPDQPAILGTFNLGAPLNVALSALRQDAAAEIADLSGGEHVRFGNKLDLQQQLNTLANHIPNRYTLSFEPTTHEPGLHTIKVQVVHQTQQVDATARTGYWSAPNSSPR